MNVEFLTPEDRLEFSELYPQAEAWLIKTHNRRRLAWMRARIQDGWPISKSQASDYRCLLLNEAMEGERILRRVYCYLREDMKNAPSYDFIRLRGLASAIGMVSAKLAEVERIVKELKEAL